jgi:DNA-binding beta-propeller fold protein YncE
MACSTKISILAVLYLFIGMLLITPMVCDQVYGADTPDFVAKWGHTGSGDGQFNGPWNAAFDSRDNVYVIDQRNSRVQKLDSNGTFMTKWGTYGSGDGQFRNPMGIASYSEI